MQDKAIITYYVSNMVLVIHNNARYLNKFNALNQAGGHFFLSCDKVYPPNNGIILPIVQIIKIVMPSSSKVELDVLYTIAYKLVYIHIILPKLGHKQLHTPIQTNKNTAAEVSSSSARSNSLKQKPWAYASTSYATKTFSYNFASADVWENSTRQTTLPRIVHLFTTATRAPNHYTPTCDTGIPS